MKKLRLAGLVVLLMLICLMGASAETAVEVTARCGLSVGGKKSGLQRMLDRNYVTCFVVGKDSYVQVNAPEGETLGGVYVQFYERPADGAVQISGHGGWRGVDTTGAWLSQWLAVPAGTTSLRLQNQSAGRMRIAEMTVYGPGDVPDSVPRWQELDKADLMLMVAHPDDELLWFGGLLPTYAGERKLAVQVAYLVPTTPRRRLELLDGLWHCGVTAYPAFGTERDVYSGTLDGQYRLWSRQGLEAQIIAMLRRYQPEVLVTHDLEGEYGHGAHKAVADAATRCVRLAAEDGADAASAALYGVWRVKKLYVHLYLQGTLNMDWHQPLQRFGGKTGNQVAAEAFAMHLSQQNRGWAVADGGLYDAGLFGLYDTTVGEDTSHDDFMEHITPSGAAADDGGSFLVRDDED